MANKLSLNLTEELDRRITEIKTRNPHLTKQAIVIEILKRQNDYIEDVAAGKTQFSAEFIRGAEAEPSHV